MTLNKIEEFYRQNHDGLSEDFQAFQEARKTDLEKAKICFAKFKKGLNLHIKAEEAVLFPFFEEKLNMKYIGPTFCRRQEHKQIEEIVNAIERRMEAGDSGFDGEERHLQSLLLVHDNKEARFIYTEINKLANQDEMKILLQKVNGFAIKNDVG
jgi:regulator of cell morphogenesis and NO signaling